MTYPLTAARIRAFLSARWAGCRIDCFDTLPSTNRAAKLLGLEDAAVAPHGTLVIADEQTAGRGRMTRSWLSRPGEGLLMSLLLRPESLPSENAAALVQLTALAVCEACRSFGADALIKWPNDIVCGGKKICGMLLEMSAEENRVRFAVAGVGLNVSGYPYAPDLPHAGCLDDACGHAVDRAEAAAVFLNRFEHDYDLWAEHGPAALDAPYRSLCVTLGSRVRVESLAENFEGTAVDLTADGSLVVDADGETRVVRAGDVSVRGLMGYV